MLQHSGVPAGPPQRGDTEQPPRLPARAAQGQRRLLRLRIRGEAQGVPRPHRDAVSGHKNGIDL